MTYVLGAPLGVDSAHRRLIDLGPDHPSRSVYISNHALPVLVQEALKAQSAHIYIVSGATYTSDAFAYSLQAAITKDRAW